MSKRRSTEKRAAHPLAEAAQVKHPALNPSLSAQTRKVLSKHYRTKYGVRSRGRS